MSNAEKNLPLPAAPAGDDAPDGEEVAPPAEWTPAAPHPNAMREAFCLAYVASPNATRAAAFAGYSLKTARQQGSRLLKDPFVLMRIEELRIAKGIVYDLPRDTLLDRAEMLFWHAVEHDRLGVALGAMSFQAKLAGHTMPGRFPPRPSAETLHLIAKMSSIYMARRFGRPLGEDEEQFAHGYAPRWRATGREVFDDPFEDIHRHFTDREEGDGNSRK
ncbi:MAG: terminase small subunit [Rhodospirillaceae bacterium]|nr:terminase small subunit [Rhodospirillaceae bacterium]